MASDECFPHREKTRIDLDHCRDDDNLSGEYRTPAESTPKTCREPIENDRRLTKDSQQT